ncbi:MAG: substrate-binding domain-containing protein [Peptococcaceae bacterium]|jgi:phosphate transport system substrate-binding protein|nr:substrate-binding domain-containing protein [Peptococcaceae bacterium]
MYAGVLTGILFLVLLVALPLAAVVAGIAANRRGAGYLLAKIGGSILCAEALFILWLYTELMTGSALMNRLFGVSSLWLAYVVCIGLFILFLLLVWKPFAVKPRRVAAVSLAAALVVITGSVAGAQSYKNSFLEVPEGDEEIRLWTYQPFESGTLAASLNEPSALTLTENLPRLDGATALYPLYAAFVRGAYPAGVYESYGDLSDYGLTYEEYIQKYGIVPEDDMEIEAIKDNLAAFSPVVCSRTQGAFENLVHGHADIAFLMDVSDKQRQMAENMGLELKLTPIGHEAFVFLVNSKNPIDGLTQDEVRAVYSGAITDWGDIGQGGVKGAIEAYQRPEDSGSQIALRKIMGGAPIIEARKDQVYGMMMGLYTAVADYKNYKNAIGYSFRYYINHMLNDEDMKKVKLLAIDGAAPTVQAIAEGTYPFADNFYAVTVTNRKYETDKEREVAGNTRKLVDWILSEQGQSLVEETGYVRLQGNTR